MHYQRKLKKDALSPFRDGSLGCMCLVLLASSTWLLSLHQLLEDKHVPRFHFDAFITSQDTNTSWYTEKVTVSEIYVWREERVVMAIDMQKHVINYHKAEIGNVMN